MKKILVVLIAVLLLAGCTRQSRTALDRWSNDMREIDRAEDVNNRMASYEYFYDMYNQIQAYKIQYETDSNPETKKAVRDILNRQISQYNSNSSKYFKEMWKGRDLPDHIDFIK